MKIQEYLEEAIQDILEARTYVSTNSIPVVRYKDFSTDREGFNIVVGVNDINRVAPNADYYECMLEARAVSYKQKDIIATDSNALVADLQDAMYQDLTTATLQSAIDTIDASSGITVDGIVNTDTTDEESEDFNVINVTTNIYLTFV